MRRNNKKFTPYHPHETPIPSIKPVKTPALNRAHWKSIIEIETIEKKKKR